MNYEVVDGAWEHVVSLRDNLRPLDRRECEGNGIPLRKTMHRTFHKSLYTRAVVSGGRTLAMWGLGGSLLGDEGNPWFLTAAGSEKFPLVFLREGRRAVDEMLEIKPYLWNYVLSDYTAAVKYVSMLGFSLDQPKWVAAGGDAYRRFWMKR